MSGFDQSLTLLPGSSQTITIPASRLNTNQSATVTLISADPTGLDFSPFLELTAPNGSVINNGTGAFTTALSPNTFATTFTIPSVVGGDYKATITDSRGGATPVTATRFTLEVNSEGVTNNNTANAGTPDVGSTRSFTGWVGATDLSDFYRFTVSQAGTITAALASPSDDADIVLLRADGSTVAITGNASDQLEFEAAIAGETFFVGVSRAADVLPGMASDGGNGSTDYTLNLTLPGINPGTGQPVTISIPAASTPDAGAPTGLSNIVGGGFYNLTDGNDNVFLSNLPLAAGLQIRALSGDDNIQGTEGADNVNGNQGADTIFGNGGNDAVLRGGKGSDFIDGGSGNDILNGNNDNDTVFGGDGDDTIRGGQGNDVLLGGNGNDYLIGDLGQDILTGGNGNDTFVLRGGEAIAATLGEADVITDFSTAQDRIGLTDGIQFSNLRFESVALTLGTSTAVDSTAIRVGDTGPYLGIVQGVSVSTMQNASLFTDASSQLAFG